MIAHSLEITFNLRCLHSSSYVVVVACSVAYSHLVLLLVDHFPGVDYHPVHTLMFYRSSSEST